MFPEFRRLRTTGLQLHMHIKEVPHRIKNSAFRPHSVCSMLLNCKPLYTPLHKCLYSVLLGLFAVCNLSWNKLKGCRLLQVLLLLEKTRVWEFPHMWEFSPHGNFPCTFNGFNNYKSLQEWVGSFLFTFHYIPVFHLHTCVCGDLIGRLLGQYDMNLFPVFVWSALDLLSWTTSKHVTTVWIITLITFNVDKLYCIATLSHWKQCLV